jgi:hypothetical protein
MKIPVILEKKTTEIKSVVDTTKLTHKPCSSPMKTQIGIFK